MCRANAKRPRVTANKMPRTRLKLLKKWLSCLLMGAKYIRQCHVGEKSGAPDWIRTNDLQLRRLPLYPAELRARCAHFTAHSPPSQNDWTVVVGVVVLAGRNDVTRRSWVTRNA